MADSSLEKLENGIDLLLEAFARLKAENRELREKIAEAESSKSLVKNRLDSIIERLDRSVAP